MKIEMSFEIDEKNNKINILDMVEDFEKKILKQFGYINFNVNIGEILYENKCDFYEVIRLTIYEWIEKIQEFIESLKKDYLEFSFEENIRYSVGTYKDINGCYDLIECIHDTPVIKGKDYLDLIKHLDEIKENFDTWIRENKNISCTI